MLFQYNNSNSVNASIPLRDPLLGNVPLVSGGGAVGAYDEGTTVSVMNSTMSNNQAYNFGGHGGAITGAHEATVLISNSVFANDQANRLGGAIHGKDANITVSNTTIKNSTISGNAIGDESGGGIGTIDSNLTVTNCIFDSNASSITAGGGGLFFHAPFNDLETYTLNVSNSTFNNNIGGGVVGGGAINVSGFIPLTGSGATITNTVFNNNTAIGGGAVYADGMSILINNSIFNHNIASGLGGAIFASNLNQSTQVTGLLDISQRPLITISNSTFNGNMVMGTPPIPPVFVFNLFAGALSDNFSGNGPISSVSTITAGGGAIVANMGVNLVLLKDIFQSNSAVGSSGGAILVGGVLGTPGAMNQAYVTSTKSICSGNSATSGNNVSVIDLAGLGPNPNGVQYDSSDGSCN